MGVPELRAAARASVHAAGRHLARTSAAGRRWAADAQRSRRACRTGAALSAAAARRVGACRSGKGRLDTSWLTEKGARKKKRSLSSVCQVFQGSKAGIRRTHYAQALSRDAAWLAPCAAATCTCYFYAISIVLVCCAVASDTGFSDLAVTAVSRVPRFHLLLLDASCIKLYGSKLLLAAFKVVPYCNYASKTVTGLVEGCHHESLHGRLSAHRFHDNCHTAEPSQTKLESCDAQALAVVLNPKLTQKQPKFNVETLRTMKFPSAGFQDVGLQGRLGAHWTLNCPKAP